MPPASGAASAHAGMALRPRPAFLAGQLGRTGRAASAGHIARAGGQKNEGAYFEYEAVDPDAVAEVEALQGARTGPRLWLPEARPRAGVPSPPWPLTRLRAAPDRRGR